MNILDGVVACLGNLHEVYAVHQAEVGSEFRGRLVRQGVRPWRLWSRRELGGCTGATRCGAGSRDWLRGKLGGEVLWGWSETRDVR